MVLSLGGGGIFRQSVRSPNLANAFSTHLSLLGSDVFWFDDDAGLCFAVGFTWAKVSRGFGHTMSLMLRFGLIVFTSFRSVEGKSSSAVA